MSVQVKIEGHCTALSFSTGTGDVPYILDVDTESVSILIAAGAVVTIIDRRTFRAFQKINIDVEVGAVLFMEVVGTVDSQISTHNVYSFSMCQNACVGFYHMVQGGGIYACTMTLEQAEQSSSFYAFFQPYLADLSSFNYDIKQKHKHPHTISKVGFYAVLSGDATLSVDGLVTIDVAARSADAAFHVKGVMLETRGAVLKALPRLEIEPFRVKASHSVSSGPVERRLVAYLNGRGIEKTLAISLLLHSGLKNALSAYPDWFSDIKRHKNSLL